MIMFTYAQHVQICCDNCAQIGDGARLRFSAEARTNKSGAKAVCTHIEALPAGWQIAVSYYHTTEQRLYFACPGCAVPRYAVDITKVLGTESINLDNLYSYTTVAAKGR